MIRLFLAAVVSGLLWPAYFVRKQKKLNMYIFIAILQTNIQLECHIDAKHDVTFFVRIEFIQFSQGGNFSVPLELPGRKELQFSNKIKHKIPNLSGLDDGNLLLNSLLFIKAMRTNVECSLFSADLLCIQLNQQHT